jgi:hypothetical protein
MVEKSNRKEKRKQKGGKDQTVPRNSKSKLLGAFSEKQVKKSDF